MVSMSLWEKSKGAQEGKMGPEIDWQGGAASAEIQALHWAVKKELRLNTHLSLALEPNWAVIPSHWEKPVEVVQASDSSL